MKYNAQAGTYSPSFFSIEINSFDKFDSIAELFRQSQDIDADFEERNRITSILSTYFHEYFHFVQDISSYYGVNTAWNTYNQIWEVIAHYRANDKIIEIPLSKEIFERIYVNHGVCVEIFGDTQLKNVDSQTSRDASIKSVEIKNSISSEGKLTSDLKYFITIELWHNENQFFYNFGSVAVLETMTHILQSRFFDTSHHDNNPFPYKSGIILAEFVLNNKHFTEENLFCLCDISLMTPYPGYTYYELLNLIKKGELKFDSSDELMELGLNYIESKWGVSQNNERAKIGLVKQLQLLSNHSHFKETVHWFELAVSEASRYRKANPRFMLDIYRSDFWLGQSLTNFFVTVGGPEITNLDNDKWHNTPLAIEDDSRVYPGFLDVLNSIWNFLIHGYNFRSCNLANYCKKLKLPVDENCHEKPWVKSQITPLCPYGAYWAVWGFQDRSPSLY